MVRVARKNFESGSVIRDHDLLVVRAAREWFTCSEVRVARKATATLQHHDLLVVRVARKNLESGSGIRNHDLLVVRAAREWLGRSSS